MEEYTVVQKGTDHIYYVLKMPEADTGMIMLANQETGQIVLVQGLQAFAQNFEYNGLVEDDENDSDDEEESEAQQQNPFNQPM